MTHSLMEIKVFDDIKLENKSIKRELQSKKEEANIFRILMLMLAELLYHF